MSADPSVVLHDGPWEHRFVAANGARFHVAEQGAGPLVLLLHGFPEYWWAWRHQLPVLADAGYRACALDLRGFGASDKPPTGYDGRTLVQDVAGVIRSLGEEDAVVIGAGLGGLLAWSLPTFHPSVVRGLVTVGMPHPLVALGSGLGGRSQLRGGSYLAGLGRAWFRAGRRLATDPAAVPDLLRRWSGTPDWPSAEEAHRYATAMTVPFAAHSAGEIQQWFLRARVTRDGRRLLAAVNQPITVPVLQVRGTKDQTLDAASAGASSLMVRGESTTVALEGVGHYPHEEAPEALNRALMRWLDRLDDA